MSRRTRKKKAMKVYNKHLGIKCVAVAQVSINLAIAITKAITESGSSPVLAFQIETLKEMARIQQDIIISNPLPITKPDKYGMYKDHRLSGTALSLPSEGVTSPCDEIIEIITREEKG